MVASVIVMNVRWVDGTIAMECQPEPNQGDSPIQTVREKKSIKDWRGWLVLNAARRQVIVASSRIVQAFPLCGSQRQRWRQEPELHRVNRTSNQV